MNLIKTNNNEEMIPLKFHLSQNYPNPFNEKTTIKYCVAYKIKVKITVYDCEGKLIEKILDEEKNAGTYEVEFNVRQCHSAKSRVLNEGEYFYQLKAGDYTNTKKMMLICSKD